MKYLFSSILPVAFAASIPLINTGRTGWTSVLTASDVQNGVCAPLTVIYARGTGEPGNIGDTVGEPLFRAFSNALNGSVALQGVNYPANPEGNANRGASGAPSMTALAKQAKTQCPETKVALLGYSQGAFVTHYALNHGGLPSEDVSAIAVFGDPEYRVNKTAFGTVSSNLIAEYCNAGDKICEKGGLPITVEHIAYMSNGAAQDAAQFVMNVTGVLA